MSQKFDHIPPSPKKLRKGEEEAAADEEGARNVTRCKRHRLGRTDQLR